MVPRSLGLFHGSLDFDHMNLETLWLSGGHSKVLYSVNYSAYYPKRVGLTHPKLCDFLAIHNDIEVKGGPLSLLSLKCASNGNQGSEGDL